MSDSSSISPKNEPTGAPEVMQKGAWAIVREAQLADPSLSTDERAILTSCSPQDVLSDIHSMEHRHTSSSRTRKYANQLQPFLQGLERFGAAMDVFSNADPHGILSLLWGSVRLVLVVCSADEILSFSYTSD